MAMDSVPPSVSDQRRQRFTHDLSSFKTLLTSKRCSHKHARKAADASDKGCPWYMPIGAPDVVVLSVSTTVNSNANQKEDLERVRISSLHQLRLVFGQDSPRW